MKMEVMTEEKIYIENDSLIISDEYLRKIRSYVPRKEYICRDFYSELVNLFDNTSENRIAFEYIVAENLLNNSKESVFKSYETTDQYFSRIDPGIRFQVRLSYNFY